jgi:class 3 adenylate cyclase
MAKKRLETRKVTAVCVDMVGSVDMARRLGPTLMGVIKTQLATSIEATATRNSGKMVTFTGDGGMLLFEGNPSWQDALTFCRQLLSEQRETNTNERGEGTQVGLACGVATGSAQQLNKPSYVAGDPLDLAGRLAQKLAKTEQVLVTEEIRELGQSEGLGFSGPGSVTIKGIGEVRIAEFLWDGKMRGIDPGGRGGRDGPDSGGPGGHQPPPPDGGRGGGQFIFTVDTLADNQMVRAADLPMRIEGRFQGRLDFHVWVVLEDSYGNYYLQNPPVKFSNDGRWEARNVVPGLGIEVVDFVRVSDAGNGQFTQMVARHCWGAFLELPDESKMLASVRIVRVE